MFSNIIDLMTRLLSKLIRLASKKVYYYLKTLNKVYVLCIPLYTLNIKLCLGEKIMMSLQCVRSNRRFKP